ELAGKLRQAAHQVGQSCPLRLGATPVPLNAVMTQVNTGQDDLAMAGGDEALDLGDDVFHRPAGKIRADARDDAIAALEEAAVLHFDVGPPPAGKAADAGGNVDDAESS